MKTKSFLIILLAFILACACKNKYSTINFYEIVINADGNTSNFTVNKNAVLASFNDSIHYGLLFSDGPNKSIIAKVHKLNYTVNETAKVLVVTNVIIDVDTISAGSSKRLMGSGQQYFDITLTNVMQLNQHGWPDCGIANVCCFKDEEGYVTCCGNCDPLPNSCSECQLMGPYLSSNLTFERPEDVPPLNDIFRNYNTLTVKLK